MIADAITRVHRRAWDEREPRIIVDERVRDELIDVLLRTGSGALASMRIENAPRVLVDAHRLHLLEHKAHEMRLRESARKLREAGIDAILAKGWALARLYPKRGLRPFGADEWLVRKTDVGRASRLLPSLANDVQSSWEGLAHIPFDTLASRAARASIEGEAIAMLAPRDHLRFAAMHFLKHGGKRAIWLVDIALLGETTDACCAIAEPHRAEIELVIGAAAELLGARVSTAYPPRWAIDAIRKTWMRGLSQRYALFERFPNALESTFYCSRLPRAPTRFAQTLALARKEIRRARA